MYCQSYLKVHQEISICVLVQKTNRLLKSKQPFLDASAFNLYFASNIWRTTNYSNDTLSDATNLKDN